MVSPTLHRPASSAPLLRLYSGTLQFSAFYGDVRPQTTSALSLPNGDDFANVSVDKKHKKYLTNTLLKSVTLLSDAEELNQVLSNIDHRRQTSASGGRFGTTSNRRTDEKSAL